MKQRSRRLNAWRTARIPVATLCITLAALPTCQRSERKKLAVPAGCKTPEVVICFEDYARAR